MDCGTKFRVIGDDTEIMHTFGSKSWVLAHFFFLVDVVDKIFTLIFCVNIISANYLSSYIMVAK